MTTTAPTQPPGMALARAVSQLLGPLPLGVALLLGAGWHADRHRLAGLGWGALAALFPALLPAAFKHLIQRWRRATDAGLGDRRWRLVYLTVATLSATAGTVTLRLLGAPTAVLAVSVSIMAGLAAAVLLNTRRRTSNHSAGAAGATVILGYLAGPLLLVTAVIPALVGWSRVRLGRHTWTEVAAGAAVFPLITR